MDAETWIWLLLPLLAGLVTAIYMARRDHLAKDDHEQRIRSLEQLEAHRQGAESGETSEAPVPAFDLAVQVQLNTQTLKGHGERLQALENEE